MLFGQGAAAARAPPRGMLGCNLGGMPRCVSKLRKDMDVANPLWRHLSHLLCCIPLLVGALYPRRRQQCSVGCLCFFCVSSFFRPLPWVGLCEHQVGCLPLAMHAQGCIDTCASQAPHRLQWRELHRPFPQSLSIWRKIKHLVHIGGVGARRSSVHAHNTPMHLGSVAVSIPCTSCG